MRLKTHQDLCFLQLGIRRLGSGQLIPPLPTAFIVGFNSRLHKAALHRGSLLST